MTKSTTPQARTPVTGTLLRLARLRRGLRQTDLADVLGVSRAAVSHYELDRRSCSGIVRERAARFLEESRELVREDS